LSFNGVQESGGAVREKHGMPTDVLLKDISKQGRGEKIGGDKQTMRTHVPYVLFLFQSRKNQPVNKLRAQKKVEVEETTRSCLQRKIGIRKKYRILPRAGEPCSAAPVKKSWESSRTREGRAYGKCWWGMREGGGGGGREGCRIKTL